MTAAEVRAIVEAELSGAPLAHGADLERGLVSPWQVGCYSLFEEYDLLTVWVVFDDRPETCDGYLVVFDERQRLFGLAVRSWDAEELTLVGWYGSFLDTLRGM